MKTIFARMTNYCTHIIRTRIHNGLKKKRKQNEQTNKQTEKLNRTVKVLNLLIPFPIFDDKEVRPVIIYQQVSATLVQLTRSGYHYVIFSLSWKWDVTCNELKMVKMYWNTSPASVTLRIPNTQVSPRRGNKTAHALTPFRTFSTSEVFPLCILTISLTTLPRRTVFICLMRNERKRL